MRAGFERLRVLAGRIESAKAERRPLARIGNTALAGLTFARLYLRRPKSNALPATIRLQPAW